MKRSCIFAVLFLPSLAVAGLVKYTTTYDYFDLSAPIPSKVGQGLGTLQFDTSTQSLTSVRLDSNDFSVTWSGAFHLAFEPGIGQTTVQRAPVGVGGSDLALELWFDHFFVPPGENPLDHLDNQSPGDAYMRVAQAGNEYWCVGPWGKAASVPEPSSIAVLMLGLVMLVVRARFGNRLLALTR